MTTHVADAQEKIAFYDNLAVTEHGRKDDQRLGKAAATDG